MIKNFTHNTIFASLKSPNYNEIFYWADLNDNADGKSIKVYNLRTKKWEAISNKTSIDLYIDPITNRWIIDGKDTGINATGPKGDIGPIGPQGVKGDKGDSGSIGPQGVQGEKGIQGDVGPQGPVGNDGPIGPQGIAGEKGDKGDPGKDGSGLSILGSYDTYEDLKTNHPTGNAGDAYLVSGDLYVWSITDNDWKNVGNIKGPKGDQGEPGIQGIQGEKGDIGETGPIGPAGEQGIQGPVGDIGPRGYTGSQGPKGDPGEIIQPQFIFKNNDEITNLDDYVIGSSFVYFNGSGDENVNLTARINFNFQSTNNIGKIYNVYMINYTGSTTNGNKFKMESFAHNYSKMRGASKSDLATTGFSIGHGDISQFTIYIISYPSGSNRSYALVDVKHSYSS